VEILQPRTYNPLISSPSPTASRSSIPASPPSPEPEPEPEVELEVAPEKKRDVEAEMEPEDELEIENEPEPTTEARPSILLPPPPGSVHIPKQHLRTVSLEKAKEMMQAPGVVHLLPEELRAQNLNRSRSHEPLRRQTHVRMDCADVLAGKEPQEPPMETATLVDQEGRERYIRSPIKAKFSVPSPPGRSSVDPGHALPGITAVQDMAPGAVHNRQISIDELPPGFWPGDKDEPRGRTKVRGQRHPSSKSDLQSDAQKIAEEYHTLLSDQYRRDSGTSATSKDTESSTEVIAQMKMVPQPLFHMKPAAKGTLSGRRESEDQSVSPGHGRAGSTATTSSQSSRGSLPLRLSLSLRPGTGGRRSTSGSIHISGPEGSEEQEEVEPFPRRMSVLAPQVQATPMKAKKSSKFRRKSDEEKRNSHYYPYVMSRKNTKKDKASGPSASNVPKLPLLATYVITERLKTPETTPTNASPLRSHPPHSDTASRGSDAASIASLKSSSPFRHRMFKTRRKKSVDSNNDSDATSPRMMASPLSPHLLPSRASARGAPSVSLGWSDLSKYTFDAVQSPTKAKFHPGVLYEHVAAPPRPMDERTLGLREADRNDRRPSIITGIMDSWKEMKAEKRREDLKIIKVVTPAHLEAQEDETASAVKSPRPISGSVERRPSLFGNWM
jgi:hypothetical protein